MARTNPCSLSRPKPAIGDKTFTDELQPGAAWPMVFEVQAGSDFDLYLAEKTDQYTAEYVSGREGKKPVLLPAIEGKRVKMTRKLCATIALLELADVTPILGVEDNGSLSPEEVAWGFDEWRALAVVAPNAFEEMSVFVGALYEQAFAAAKN